MSAATVETWEPGTPLYERPRWIAIHGGQWLRLMVEIIEPGDAAAATRALDDARFERGVCFRCEVTWGDPTAACWCCGNPGQVSA